MCLLLAALIGVALAVYFEPTHCVRGWLWGEAFYQGRPTSYWRGVVEHDLSLDVTSPVGIPAAIGIFDGGIQQPTPTWWQRCKGWLGYGPRQLPSMSLVTAADAQSVLEELAADPDADVAGFARDTLKEYREPEFLVPIALPSGQLFVVDRYQRLILGHCKTLIGVSPCPSKGYGRRYNETASTFQAPKERNVKAQGNALGNRRRPECLQAPTFLGRNICRALLWGFDGRTAANPGRCPGLSCCAPSELEGKPRSAAHAGPLPDLVSPFQPAGVGVCGFLAKNH